MHGTPSLQRIAVVIPHTRVHGPTPRPYPTLTILARCHVAHLLVHVVVVGMGTLPVAVVGGADRWAPSIRRILDQFGAHGSRTHFTGRGARGVVVDIIGSFR